MNVYPIFEFDVSEWLNAPDFDTESLRGRVVLIETFQMLCPGCVAYGIPQALKVHRSFAKGQVAVVGLHTVFEHHAAMGPDSLKVFLHEYRIDFPVGVDRHVQGRPTPSTMSRYGLQGTPSTLLLDRAGQLRHTSFGQVDDLALGALLGQLLTESAPEPVSVAADGAGAVCAPGVGCT
ncbi:MAG: peroxiredoxin family protein [Sporichthyaceae bacterium]